MRHVILLDNKISDGEFEQWKNNDTEFWKKHLSITPQYWVIRQDYSDYPTYVDSDGDIRASDAWLQALTNIVVSKYNDFGTDFIMVMIHEDNWKSDNDTIKGIWGTNYSYKFGKQCIEYCRWDRDSIANTFGTAYHERHHSFDAIIKQELGVDIAPILNVEDYDRCITHGKCSPWKYIRYQENLESLRIMRPYLVNAFKKRQERHDKTVEQYKTVITQLEQLIYLLRMSFNKKSGVPRDL